MDLSKDQKNANSNMLFLGTSSSPFLAQFVFQQFAQNKLKNFTRYKKLQEKAISLFQQFEGLNTIQILRSLRFSVISFVLLMQ